MEFGCVFREGGFPLLEVGALGFAMVVVLLLLDLRFAVLLVVAED